MVYLKRNTAIAMLFCMALLLTGTSVAAQMLDLTIDNSGGSILDAYFKQVDPEGSTGTGIIQPFLRIQKIGVEEGYNTDYRPHQFPEATDVWTKSLLLSDVPIVYVLPNGTTGEWREFLLDVNENSGGTNEYISLDELEIYLGPSGNLTGYPSFGGVATQVWDMNPASDPDNWIKLDYSLEAGSGDGDMLAYIPNRLFVGGNYVYLYSKFGVQGADLDACDGFEEWSVRDAIPEPAGLLVLCTGIAPVLCLGIRKLRR